MSNVFTSLDDASDGDGTASNLGGNAYAHHTMLVYAYGAPLTEVTVVLEGSHDGTNWKSLGVYHYGDSSGGVVHADKVVDHVRAVITSVSGTDVSVTATIGSA